MLESSQNVSETPPGYPTMNTLRPEPNLIGNKPEPIMVMFRDILGF